jgi:hypothetical protein
MANAAPTMVNTHLYYVRFYLLEILIILHVYQMGVSSGPSVPAISTDTMDEGYDGVIMNAPSSAPDGVFVRVCVWMTCEVRATSSGFLVTPKMTKVGTCSNLKTFG